MVAVARRGTDGYCDSRAVAAGAQADAKTDPRVGLKAGWKDAGEAASGMALIGHGQKPEGFYNPDNLGDFGYLDSDLAFSGHYVFQGNFHGMQIWDVSDPAHPTLAHDDGVPRRPG